jgi:hypothetical protein
MIGTGADVRKKSRRLRIMLLKVASVFVIGLAGNSALSQQLKMKITGDTATGFSVDIFDGSQLLLHNTGEFSLRNSVGHSFFTDDIMPLLNGYLRSKYSGSFAMSVFDNF